jgi:hypothetical protein
MHENKLKKEEVFNFKFSIPKLALSPISVMNSIEMSLLLEPPTSD